MRQARQSSQMSHLEPGCSTAAPRPKTFAVLAMVTVSAAGCTEPPSCFKASIRGLIEVALEMHSDPLCVPGDRSGGLGDEYRGENDYPPWPPE